jgi:tRNA (mo5U34)-methyltransferase
MKFYQRVCLILAYEGISGLFRRTLGKLSAKSKFLISSNPQVIEEKDRQYAQLVSDFNEKVVAMGYEDVSNYMWYHTIDLGNGLVTPGACDYRSTLPLFQFPTDMTGMNVLDVGSATGFFAFEFEKRGANVTSVELPSIADWDMPLGEDREKTLKELMAIHQVNTVEDLQYRHLDGPFEFCRKVLNSKVKRCHSTIYDLSPEKLGRDAFDLVFLGDILLHIFSPLKALASVAPLCRSTLIISQELPNTEDPQPMMQYIGGETRGGDSRSWWLPNKLCFEQMLKRLGFKTVSVVYDQKSTPSPEKRIFYRAIIHATK